MFRLLTLLSLTSAPLWSPIAAETALATPTQPADPQSQPNIESIAAQARLRGDARRGARLFYTSAAACAKCHASGDGESLLGPDLANLGLDATGQHQAVTAEHIVESLLEPSKSLRKGFETLAVLTQDGQVFTGLKIDESDLQLRLRDVANPAEPITINRHDIEEIRTSARSLMPEGLITAFREERDLFDLVRYVTEVANGGPARAAELKPSADKLLVVDDTDNLDHAGILRSLGQDDFRAGQQIYLSDCKQCHGADGNTPALPTARAFGLQPMKYGADPYKMLHTLTHGAGLMPAMQHLSPRERYQVIHYIREGLMRDRNDAYIPVDEQYLATLPIGTSQGEIEVDMSPRDFGPVLASQIGSRVNNALTFRLNDGITASYDLHRMRASAWEGGFLDLSETHHYRQRGEGMPQVAGDSIFGLDTWGWLYSGQFDLPNDAKPPRGPLRSDWLQYQGYYLYGDQAVLSYRIHGRQVLETLHAQRVDARPLIRHTLRIDPGDQPLELCVGQLMPDETALAGGTGHGFIVDQQTLTGPATATAFDHAVFVVGQPSAQQARAVMANRPWHVIIGKEASNLDLGTPGRTVVARFRTSGDGTLIASTPQHGRWKPNGKSLFIRGNRLVFDIGWVGAMVGSSNVADGQWHTAALVVDDMTTRLYVDGKLEAEAPAFRRPPETEHVLKVGATATNFGGDFSGEIATVQIHPSAWPTAKLKRLTELDLDRSAQPPPLFSWQPSSAEDPSGSGATNHSPSAQHVLAAMVIGDADQCQWRVEPSGRILLSIPASDRPRSLSVLRCSSATGSPTEVCGLMHAAVSSRNDVVDLGTLTRGGSQRWPQLLETHGELGASVNGYALDTIHIPFDNPWNAWMRTSALDFLSDGRAVVTTHGGDVYLVSGLDERLAQVTWKRFAAGLFEPFGVRVIDDRIYVTCRDGINRLHDFNGDDEADFIEAFWSDDDVSSMFHAYNFDLQSDSDGNLYFAKAGQYSQHHRPGTIMRIGPQGGAAEVIAWGLRTPNGMGKLADDRFTVSDNQGPWIPAGKISLVEPGSFLGNMPINDQQTDWLKQQHGGQLPTTFQPPIVWTPQELDNSCGGQLWVDDPRFGPLSGRLLHSSFGKGWLYTLSLQEISGQLQGSIVALPHQWEAGVMRLRTNPADGQLYGTGLSGWQGPAEGRDGCLQRLRYTGSPVQFIEHAQVFAGGVELRFSFEFDPDSVIDPRVWNAEMWNYLWSERYGSDQYSVLRPGDNRRAEKGRDPLTVDAVNVIDSHTVRLFLSELKECDQFSLQMNFRDKQGQPYIEHIYMTINAMPAS
jgi:putative heme-binding domain-containing protein